jgi:hypothetical protein
MQATRRASSYGRLGAFYDCPNESRRVEETQSGVDNKGGERFSCARSFSFCRLATREHEPLSLPE